MSKKIAVTIDIKTLIAQIRLSDPAITEIFTQGGCYQFWKILRGLSPDFIPYINKDQTHVIAKYDDEFFDIYGEAEGRNYHKMTYSDIRVAEKWSFSKNHVLAIGNCPNCDEPIIPESGGEL